MASVDVLCLPSAEAETMMSGAMSVIFSMTTCNSLPNLASFTVPVVAPMRTRALATPV